MESLGKRGNLRIIPYNKRRLSLPQRRSSEFCKYVEREKREKILVRKLRERNGVKGYLQVR